MNEKFEKFWNKNEKYLNQIANGEMSLKELASFIWSMGNGEGFKRGYDAGMETGLSLGRIEGD